MKMNPEVRAEFRRAIADEVATLRAVNTALRGPLTPADAAHLHAVRAEAVSILRNHLSAVYFSVTPKKPCGSVRIREVSK